MIGYVYLYFFLNGIIFIFIELILNIFDYKLFIEIYVNKIIFKINWKIFYFGMLYIGK